MIKGCQRTDRFHEFVIRFDSGGRQVKSQLREQSVAACIKENSTLNGAYKHVSSVGFMSLVAGGSQWESAQPFKVGRSRSLLHQICRPIAHQYTMTVMTHVATFGELRGI